MTAHAPAHFCRGLLAYRRHQLGAGALSEQEVALQPAFERVCGYVASREHTAERFRDILEEWVLGSPDERVAVARSAILGAWQDPAAARVAGPVGRGAGRGALTPPIGYTGSPAGRRPPAASAQEGGAMRAVIDDSGPTLPPEERRPSAEGGLLPMLGRGTLRRVAVGPVEVPLAAIALGRCREIAAPLTDDGHCRRWVWLANRLYQKRAML